jgi:hypothetical protein
MAKNQTAEILSEENYPVELVPGEEHGFRPWLFRDQNLVQTQENAKPISQETLTNKLNHINFLDRPILVHLRDPKYEESILLRAYPGPCYDRKITCRWSHEDLPDLNLANYQFLDLVIDEGQSMILVPAQLQEINRDSFTIRLPHTSYVVGQRKIRRYVCSEVNAELIQSGFQAFGELLDFSPDGFRIRMRPGPSCAFHWFNSEESVTIHLRHNQQLLFSGPCRCIREEGGLSEREIVLEPAGEKIKRFERKPIRNIRQQLVPSPTVTFDHPFFKRRIHLDVYDISTSGISVYEKADEGILMPGMIIPKLTINFAGSLKMACAAQVIHRKKEGEGFRCGFAILDMDIDTYSRLTHILTSALDPHAHISNGVDLDDLWEFFFDTGFLNPEKYHLIHSYRESFRETYRRLYKENPEIARHFTYQKNGRIYGHISMVQAYEQAWMIHHHAARALENKRAGFIVLKQIMHYLNDMCRLPSANMDYVMSFFRPENRFPNKVFGGFAKALKKPQGCSMDTFCYSPHMSLSMGVHLPQGWSLKESSETELCELNHFYGHASGGLLLDVLGLGKEENSRDESLKEVYSGLGFMRKWRAYSLTHKGELNAVLIANQSNLGLNLSELLNSIMVLVTNPEGLSWNILSVAIGQLTGKYKMEKVPVLFYPFEYVEANNVPYEKQYNLWILNVRYGNEYLEYMQTKFRIK